MDRKGSSTKSRARYSAFAWPKGHGGRFESGSARLGQAWRNTSTSHSAGNATGPIFWFITREGFIARIATVARDRPSTSEGGACPSLYFWTANLRSPTSTPSAEGGWRSMDSWMDWNGRGAHSRLILHRACWSPSARTHCTKRNRWVSENGTWSWPGSRSRKILWKRRRLRAKLQNSLLNPKARMIRREYRDPAGQRHQRSIFSQFERKQPSSWRISRGRLGEVPESVGQASLPVDDVRAFLARATANRWALSLIAENSLTGRKASHVAARSRTAGTWAKRTRTNTSAGSFVTTKNSYRSSSVSLEIRGNAGPALTSTHGNGRCSGDPLLQYGAGQGSRASSTGRDACPTIVQINSAPRSLLCTRSTLIASDQTPARAHGLELIARPGRLSYFQSVHGPFWST